MNTTLRVKPVQTAVEEDRAPEVADNLPPVPLLAGEDEDAGMDPHIFRGID